MLLKIQKNLGPQLKEIIQKVYLRTHAYDF